MSHDLFLVVYALLFLLDVESDQHSKCSDLLLHSDQMPLVVLQLASYSPCFRPYWHFVVVSVFSDHDVLGEWNDDPSKRLRRFGWYGVISFFADLDNIGIEFIKRD